jgi:hypothetical protein
MRLCLYLLLFDARWSQRQLCQLLLAQRTASMSFVEKNNEIAKAQIIGLLEFQVPLYCDTAVFLRALA